jgi:hypothetical protein
LRKISDPKLPFLARTALILLALVAKAPAVALQPAVAELWVDAFASGPEEGTAARPYRSLELALSKLSARGGRVFLAKGLYRGPFRTAANVEIQGSSPAVLFVDGNETVLSSSGSLLLTNVSIQGGAIGLETSGPARLDGVQLSGQRRVGLRVASGELNVIRGRLSASIADIVGIELAPGARAVVDESSFDGPFGRAIELRSKSSLQVRDVEWRGSKVGIHQSGGKSFIRQARFVSGTGPAVTVGMGELHSEGMVVFGHEYGLLANEGATVALHDFTSVRAERAAIALVRARAELDDIHTVNSGSFGAIQLVSSEAVIRHFWLHHAVDYAIQARDSRLDISNGVITEVRDVSGDEGDGIHLRNSKGSVQSVVIRSAQGAGILAAERSSVALRDLEILRCRAAGVVSDTLAQVSARSLVVRSSEGAAIVALGRSRVTVEGLASEKNEQGPVWAECQNGASVELWRVRSDQGFELMSPCVLAH